MSITLSTCRVQTLVFWFWGTVWFMVQKFKYLGAEIDEKNNVTLTIQERI